MSNNKPFLFHTEWIDALEDYPSDIRLGVYDAITWYAKRGTLPEMNPLVKMAFSYIKRDMDEDKQRYEQVCNINRNNGKMGGRPRKPSGFMETEKTDGFLENPSQPKKPYYDYDSDNDYDNDNDKKEKEIKEKKKTFNPPTVDEVREYCIERNNNIDPVKFCDFYQMKGWMVGKNKMKDWKAAIRTWENKDKQEQPAKTVWVDYSKTAMQRRLEHAQH